MKAAARRRRIKRLPTRQAACHCGQLRLEVTGDPSVVSICHCLDCQRRTESAFGMQSAFKPDQVEIVGRYSDYSRISDEADEGARLPFLPRLRLTGLLHGANQPDLVVISVGAFADPEFPPPTESGYNSRRHEWFDLPEEIAASRPSSGGRSSPMYESGKYARPPTRGAAARRSSGVPRPGLQRRVLREPRGPAGRRDRASPPRDRRERAVPRDGHRRLGLRCDPRGTGVQGTGGLALALFDPESHEPLVAEPWRPSDRGAIRGSSPRPKPHSTTAGRLHGTRTSAALPHRLPRRRRRDPGARRAAAARARRARRDYVPYLERDYVPDFPEYDHERSLLMGKTGIVVSGHPRARTPIASRS